MSLFGLSLTSLLSSRYTLRSLDFEVRVYNDLPFKQLERTLEEAARDDHSDADCIFVAILSHGEMGILYACDQERIVLKELDCVEKADTSSVSKLQDGEKY